MNLPFIQTKEYLSWHDAVGTKTFYLEFFRDVSQVQDFQIDEESTKEKYAVAACVVLNLRIGKVLYVPYGPVFFDTHRDPTSVSTEEKNKVIKELYEKAVKENCAFVRIEDENNIFKNTKYLISPKKKTFSKEGIFQPRMEWWLDLNESEEGLLNRIHKDHKYSIRRAQKENVEVEIITENLENYFEHFWKLLKETGERDGFSLYEENYYRQIFKHPPPRGGWVKKFLVFTKMDDKYLSVALIVISDKVANLVFAGSISEKRELGFNHLMQWSAILESKKHGCEIYNFGGITEDGYGKESLRGVTNFKKKFGGYAKFHGNFLDMPTKKIKYFVYMIRKMI